MKNDNGSKSISNSEAKIAIAEAKAGSASRITEIPTEAPGKAKKTAEVRISLPQLEILTMNVRIVGDTPLICHPWSEKAVRMIADKITGEATGGREVRNFDQDFVDSLYYIERPTNTKDGRYGFPSTAFKAAAVDACTSLKKQITKVQACQAFHVSGTSRSDLVEIHGTPTSRQDMVKIGQSGADVRIRAEFLTWHATLVVRYNISVLSASQLVNLFNLAGFAVGVGEWRVQKSGNNGMFHCETCDLT